MRRARTFLAIVIAMACASIVLIIALARHDDDPLDAFQVQSSVANGDGHAVLVTYHHANSSTRWDAVWLSDKPGSVGSVKRWVGQPIAAWTGTPVDVFWRDGRWTLTVEANVTRRSPSTACYFDYGNRPLVCFDAAQITVVDR